mmetsp:Transcript_16812/g.54993  ORF Transcript_16812/g.54993 Transcript_16812/m.54993 type:complete len:238 (-) Transcript_16812:268-981(-)
MSLFEAFFGLRVRYPFVGFPHGLEEGRPPEVRPSPPPCGWSMGFMATPRTVGRRPSQRAAPALPRTVFLCCSLETLPTVAMHVRSTLRTSRLERRTSAYPSSPFLMSVAFPPAARTSCAPRPGWSSMLWSVVPTGMFCSGRAFPTRIGASGPAWTVSPGAKPLGAKMYACSGSLDPSASSYLTSAMRAVRFGSYSNRSTRPRAVERRLKSIMRYNRFVPPPLCRTVMRPRLFRPRLR